MKVLMIPSWYATKEGEIAGNYILDHARAVKAMSWSADILYVYRALQSQTSVDVERGVRVVRYAAPFSAKRGLLGALWRNAVKTAFEEYCAEYGTPDIVHAHGYVAGSAALEMTDQEIPVVVTEHNSAFVRGLAESDLETATDVFTRADAVISVSEFLAEHIRSACDVDIQVIPNPVDEGLFTLDGDDKQRDQVLCIAGLETIKRVELAIDAFELIREKHDDLKLTIIGDGPERKNLERYAARPGMEDCYHFTGMLAKDEIVAYLQRARLLLSTSDIETFGITLVEALMCGVPVVCTPSGGVSEIVAVTEGKVSEDHSAEGIAEAAGHILAQPTNTRRLHEMATSHFSYETVGKQITTLYNKAIEAKRQVN